MAIFAAEGDEEMSTRESADKQVALEDFLATFRDIYHDHRADLRTEVGSADGE